MALFGISVGIVLILSAREPRYHGRSLTSWLQQCFDTPLMETQRLAEAQDAVRAVGAKRALPKLLRLVESKDDPVSLWIMDAGDKLRLSDESGLGFIRWHSAQDFQWLGVRGFEALGTNAAPAAAELGKLLDQKDRILVTERCLEAIGKPAEPVLCRALTNQDERIRQWAIDELAPDTDDVVEYIARIKPRLQDSSITVRSEAVDAIGIQANAPELAIPLLLDALKDSAVSANAANALANFGTNSLVAFPQLVKLVDSEDESTASAALRALIVIAPDESFPILTNCIARGKPKTDEALQALVDESPGKALALVLDGMQSADINRRRAAFRLLRKYPMTPKVESAMKSAAADPDSMISADARKILTGQYLAGVPFESQFPDEPSYEGKPLGDWLKNHDREGDFSPEAKDALRHIGTNAIPALLERLVYVQPPFGLPAYEVNIAALRGFIALGENAKPALPQLKAIMEGTNEDFALFAMMASCGTGSNAMPLLMQGLTSRFANVRGEAAHNLTEGIGAQFPDQRKRAVPFLVKFLNDPDMDVRINATNELKEIDPEAAAKAGIK
ncbi:MAG TPA: HEAT repeat domain-containing protein [Verrucomicrobiae bacterium]|nr:HEAT repeat domain-containing protein [Verrucomicrobiae bacterium]